MLAFGIGGHSQQWILDTGVVTVNDVVVAMYHAVWKLVIEIHHQGFDAKWGIEGTS